jgi:hypothetical protein
VCRAQPEHVDDSAAGGVLSSRHRRSHRTIFTAHQCWRVAGQRAPSGAPCSLREQPGASSPGSVGCRIVVHVRIGSLTASSDSLTQVDYTVVGAAAAALQGVRLPREQQQQVEEVHVQFDLVPKVRVPDAVGWSSDDSFPRVFRGNGGGLKCVRDVKEVHTTWVGCFLRPSCVKKVGGLVVRERSEFPQYQTYQLYVRWWCWAS